MSQLLSGAIKPLFRNYLQPCHEVRKYRIKFVTTSAARCENTKKCIARSLNAKCEATLNKHTRQLATKCEKTSRFDFGWLILRQSGPKESNGLKLATTVWPGLRLCAECSQRPFFSGCPVFFSISGYPRTSQMSRFFQISSFLNSRVAPNFCNVRFFRIPYSCSNLRVPKNLPMSCFFQVA